jgi:hypothetical protein
MSRVLLFSLTAMANPTLVAATTVMLLLPSPKRLMLGYLLGALLTSITLGLVIVFTLKDSSLISTGKRTINPAEDFAFGAILLVIAFVVESGRVSRLRERRKRSKTDSAPPRWQQALGRGSPRVTFVVGVVLTLPGASYLAALSSIIRLDPGTAPTVLLVLMVNLIMLAFLELPLLGFAIAPDWTTATIERAKAWFRRNGARALVIGTATIGSLLIVRGVITIA